MYHQIARCVVEGEDGHSGVPPTRTRTLRRPGQLARLVRLVSRDGVAAVMLACVAAAAACTTERSTSAADVQLQDLVCRTPLPDGSCQSMPADCPVMGPAAGHPRQPTCPVGAELIPLVEDTCAHQLICVD